MEGRERPQIYASKKLESTATSDRYRDPHRKPTIKSATLERFRPNLKIPKTSMKEARFLFFFLFRELVRIDSIIKVFKQTWADELRPSQKGGSNRKLPSVRSNYNYISVLVFVTQRNVRGKRCKLHRVLAKYLIHFVSLFFFGEYNNSLCFSCGKCP